MGVTTVSGVVWEAFAQGRADIADRIFSPMSLPCPVPDLWVSDEAEYARRADQDWNRSGLVSDRTKTLKTPSPPEALDLRRGIPARTPLGTRVVFRAPVPVGRSRAYYDRRADLLRAWARHQKDERSAWIEDTEGFSDADGSYSESTNGWGAAEWIRGPMDRRREMPAILRRLDEAAGYATWGIAAMGGWWLAPLCRWPDEVDAALGRTGAGAPDEPLFVHCSACNTRYVWDHETWLAGRKDGVPWDTVGGA